MVTKWCNDMWPSYRNEFPVKHHHIMDRGGKLNLIWNQWNCSRKRAFVEIQNVFYSEFIQFSRRGFWGPVAAKPYISSLPTNSIHHSSAGPKKNKFELSQLSWVWKQQTVASPHLTPQFDVWIRFLTVGDGRLGQIATEAQCPCVTLGKLWPANFELPSSNADTFCGQFCLTGEQIITCQAKIIYVTPPPHPPSQKGDLNMIDII